MIIDGFTKADIHQLKVWHRFMNQLNTNTTIISEHHDPAILDRFVDMGVLTWGRVMVEISPSNELQTIVIRFTEYGLEIVDTILSFEDL